MTSPVSLLFNALIRTHHITSRKKVAILKKAASNHECYVLLRSGGSPGIMYVEGSERGVEQWVATVQKLRYKDYQLAAKPAPMQREQKADYESQTKAGFHEVNSVKEFAGEMSERRVMSWWKRGMRYLVE